MAGPGQTLKEVHRLHSYIHDLDTRITQAPRQAQLHKNKLQLAEDNLKAAQDEIKHLKVTILDRESSIKGAYLQIAKWEKQRDGIENKKEFDALNTEISQAQGRIKKFEDEILETMGQVEEKTAKLPDVEKATKQVRADVAKFEKEYQDRLAQLAQDKAKTEAELTAVEVQLPPEIMPVFTKLVTNMGPDSFSNIEGRACVACYTEVTAQMANEIRKGMFMLCKSCGRMLYAS